MADYTYADRHLDRWSPEIRIASDDRQVGQTTALLDVAIANARRGLVVDFMSPSPGESRNAAAAARRLVLAADPVRLVQTNGAEEVRYVSGGRVRFLDRVRAQFGAHREDADMVIFDGRFGGGITRPGADVRKPRSRRMDFI